LKQLQQNKTVSFLVQLGKTLLLEAPFTLVAWCFALSLLALFLFLSQHLILVLCEKIGLALEEIEQELEQKRRWERPERQKAIEAFILLKSIQERARMIRPTPYKLTSNIHCVLNKVCF